MAQQVINNGESGSLVRSKINGNFTELYTEVAAPIAASEVTNTPSGTVVSTNVQGAVNELDGDIQNINDNFASATRGNVESMLIAGSNMSLAYSGSGASRQVTLNAADNTGQLIDGTTPFLALPGAFISTAISAAALATQAAVANEILVCPFVVAFDTSIDQIGVSVSTLLAGSTVRVVIFDADALGRPTTILATSDTIDGATTGTKAVALNFTFQRNKIYWVGVWASGTVTLRIPGATTVPLGWSNAATPAPSRGLIKSVAYATTGSAGNWGTFANTQISARTPFFVYMRLV